MNKRWRIPVVTVIVIIAIVLLWREGKLMIIGSDTTIATDFFVASGDIVILKNGAKLTVTGNVTIDGTLACEGGALELRAGGVINVEGTLECMRDTTGTGANPDLAISLIASNIVVSEHAQVIAGGHVLIVSDVTLLPLSLNALKQHFEETSEDSGGPLRLGPLLGEPARSVMQETAITQTTLRNPTSEIDLRGNWHIGDSALMNVPLSRTPEKSIKQVRDILFFVDAGAKGVLSFTNMHLGSTAGVPGKNDIDVNCHARGEDGADGVRIRANAGTISIQNWELNLGSGGNGGNAQTVADCALATAIGGAGGETGNFKFTAARHIAIADFYLRASAGGVGGDAHAFGRNAASNCPGENGGNASALGGEGGMNKKALASKGEIAGLRTLRIDRAEGGKGGDAQAYPGEGGMGRSCGCAGGVGGSAEAIAGNGGSAFLLSSQTGEAHGGDGGDARSVGARGGAGGNCSSKDLKPTDNPTGYGGTGGKAKSVAGLAGMGTTANGTHGVVKDQTGGAGGNGGDGCKPSPGGVGGIGAPRGKNGEPGKNLCPGADAPLITPPPPTIPMISAILYHGKHLPVDQLIQTNKAGCGESHWRAAKESVIATDGSSIPDPIFQCGYGTVRENQPITVPKEVIRVNIDE